MKFFPTSPQVISQAPYSDSHFVLISDVPNYSILSLPSVHSFLRQNLLFKIDFQMSILYFPIFNKPSFFLFLKPFSTSFNFRVAPGSSNKILNIHFHPPTAVKSLTSCLENVCLPTIGLSH